jgi:DNA polymerase-3 subunit epsilon
MMGRLVYHEGVEIPPAITEITGITQEEYKQHGYYPQQVWGELRQMTEYADYYCAHNAPFDRGFLESFRDQLSIAYGVESVAWPNAPWIDTKMDLNYPARKQKGDLTTMAAHHGFLNPFPHRALFDVLTMFKIADQYDWDETIKRQQSPTVEVQAVVTYDEREKAKAEGFYWKADQKIWVRNFKLCDVKHKSFPFQVKEIENEKS